MSSLLDKPFEEMEILAALKECSSVRAPGPNDFNFSFIKKGWEFMKSLIFQFFAEFYSYGRLTKGINCTFVGLIPKVNCPVTFKDFRPISMIGWVYKVLSKVLTNRFKPLLPCIIGDAQATFIGGKQIVDAVLIAK